MATATRPLIEETIREAARLDLLVFAHFTSRKCYETAPHLRYLMSELAKYITSPSDRLMVNSPPGTSKSETVSVYFTAWYLGIYPNARVMLAAFEHELAVSFSRRVRDILAEWRPDIFGVAVERGRWARFERATGGSPSTEAASS